MIDTTEYRETLDNWAKEPMGVIINLADEALDEIDTLRAEVKRLSNREGTAHIELCYNADGNPFEREDLALLDYGVADNCYVVESKLFDGIQATIKDLHARLEAVEVIALLAVDTWGEQEVVGFQDILAAARGDTDSTPKG